MTRRVAIGEKEVRISAPAAIEVLKAQTDQLSLRLSFSSPGEYTVFLQGVAAIGQAQLGVGSSTGAELTSFAVRSGSGFAEVHLKVTEEGASHADITLSALEANGSPAASTTITMHPGHATVDVGSNTSLSVTASNATSYQWQVNTGEGFVNVSNAGPYSGAKSASLTLAGVTADMNGYAYRVIASGSVLPAAVSDSAILTVNIPPETSITPKDEDNPTSAPTTTSSAPTATNKGVDVLVNGKVESAGTATTTIVNNQSVTTIVLDQTKLEEKMKAEGQHAVITIQVNTNSDVVVGELSGQMVKNMEQMQAILEIKTDKGTYTLPVEQINIHRISDQIGKSVMLQDLKIQIEIAVPTVDTMKIVENAAVNGEFTIAAPPLNFAVRATYGDTRIDISKFNTYVERMIALPDGIDPNKLTTGVVIELDGTVRHVPTLIVHQDGKYYAKLQSLTNSTYAIIWNPLNFEDVAHHWAKDTVNDMGSRMVISGIGNDLFNPDQDITRAEFAAMMVRGLGFKLEKGGTMPFADLKASDWYSSAVHTAYSYDLINGFEDGTFLPMDKLTREQAMVMIAKAMKITGLRANLIPDLAGEWLSPFADMNDSSEWAKNSMAACLQAGIVSGRNDSELDPKAYITRAEVAIMIQRLLQKSELI
ncbi:Endo-1,4-beta-xylanase A precursor [compost metagenome]